MKKIIIAVLAVAAMVACSKEQTVVAPKGDAIGFSTFVENSTRATDITTANIADFGVYGTVAKGGNSALIFNNTKVSGSKDAGYTYSPAQYWIAAAEYDFLAFAPYTNAKWTYAPLETNAQVAQNGTFSFNNETAAADQDVVYAYTTKTTEATLTAENTQAVAFTFKHILSKVAFSFTNTFTDGNTTLSVYNVKINNTAKTGTMAIADGVDAAWVGADDLVVAFGEQFTDVNKYASAALANGKELKLAHHYVIPAQRAYNITFSVDLYQAGVYLATYNHTINTTIDFAKNGNYVLSVKLAPESIDPANPLFPIEFTVNKVEDWDNYYDVALAAETVATAQELAAAVAEGGDIRLTSDITLSGSELRVAKDKEVYLDLNGNTLTVAALDPIDNYGKMTIANGKVVGGNTENTRRCIYNRGEMVIENMEFVQIWDEFGAAINNEGKMTINNTTVDAVRYAVWSSGANAETIINSGTFSNETDMNLPVYAVVAYEGAKMTINGGTFISDHGCVCACDGSQVLINGGTFTCTNEFSTGSDWVFAGGDGSNAMNNDGSLIKYDESECVINGNILNNGCVVAF